MDTIKSLTITGVAAQDAMKPRRSTSRKKQSVGGVEDEMPAPFSRTEEIPPKMSARQYVQQPTKPSVQQPLLQAPVPAQQPIEVQEVGSVILRPPKVQRVKLQPKIQMKSVAYQTPLINTRKARKIHMTVANLNHRFTRAKKVREDTGAKSMDAIRDFLVGKGVIQIKSKAPEKMLRSMYSDFMLLKDQAL